MTPVLSPMSMAGAAFGGAVGALCRYIIVTHMSRGTGSLFPWGTLIVNVAGSFLIGFLFVVLYDRFVVDAVWRTVLIAGFLGGMTTFSAFSLETLLLIESGAWGSALVYVLASVFVCLAATFAGLAFARLIF